MHNSNLIYIYIYIYIYLCVCARARVSMGSKSTFECVIELFGFAGVEDGALFRFSQTLLRKWINPNWQWGFGNLDLSPVVFLWAHAVIESLQRLSAQNNMFLLAHASSHFPDDASWTSSPSFTSSKFLLPQFFFFFVLSDYESQCKILKLVVSDGKWESLVFKFTFYPSK